MLATFPNMDLTWDDLDWLRGQTKLPLPAKGVLAGEVDAAPFEHEQTPSSSRTTAAARWTARWPHSTR